MTQRFILVAYDISNDRRRAKLHDALLNFGTPVQYSVFECLLDKAGEQAMRQAVRRVIRPRVDHVRYYRLCADCVALIETTGGREVLSELPPATIV